MRKRSLSENVHAEEVIRRRLDKARREIENYPNYDYILINDRLEQSVDQLQAIVLGERIRRSGKPPSPAEKQYLVTAEKCLKANMEDKIRDILAPSTCRPAATERKGDRFMKLKDGFDSNYRYVLVAARRARQLSGGATAGGDKRRKPCKIAQQEIDAGKIQFIVKSKKGEAVLPLRHLSFRNSPPVTLPWAVLRL